MSGRFAAMPLLWHERMRTQARPVERFESVATSFRAVWETVQMPFALGQHGRVRQDRDYPPGPWPSEPTGRLAALPDGLPFDEVETLSGKQRMWFVIFDAPQRDADGDGPYRESQVLQKYLEAID
jgi:hypothetical protein